MRRVTVWGARAVVVLVVSAVLGTLALEGALRLFPWPYALDAHSAASTTLLDRHGMPLREVVGATGERALWVDLDEMSPWVVEGTIAIEDRRFREHGGIDSLGVLRAVRDNATQGEVVSGASTLSMQLARMVAEHPRTLWGKGLQAIDAVRLERAVDKDTVLVQYLNRAPYGAGTRGVEAASRRTFGKASRHLSLAEAALIAGLPQSPSAHHPFVDEDAAVRRQRQVLVAMRDTGVITEGQLARAWDEPLIYRDGLPRPEAMHFTDAVLAGHVDSGTTLTTLDRDLQRVLQRLTQEHVDALRSSGLTQSAVVVLDNATCDVLAMVGSADWWQGAHGRVNGATSARQPGSALKPWAYATAWEQGYTPASVVADIPTRYDGGDGALMRPRNYDETFMGPLGMGEALGRSLNVPAVRTANAAGIQDVLDAMRQSGLSSLSAGADHYGLGLVLGNGEVTPLELAAGYAMFARGGVSCTPRLLLDAPVDEGERVFSEETASLITSVLSDDALRARAFGARSSLMLGFPVAVKTGTSTDFRDSWAAGYTPTHTVVVWGGDSENRPMQHVSGAVGSGPLFHEVVRTVVLRGSVQTQRAFEPHPDTMGVEVCAQSGKRPTAHCPTRHVVVSRHSVPTEPCAWHSTVRMDRRNGLRASEQCPQEYVTERIITTLPPEYAAWQDEQGLAAPAQYSPLCAPDQPAANAVVIVHPRPGDVFLVEPGYARDTQTVELSVQVDPPVREVTWWVDGQPVQTQSWPYTGAWSVETGHHQLVAIAGGRRSEPISFEVR